MPPKKVQEPEKKPLIGRVGTNLKVGIVGVPNVGKSTFFNVLTKSSAAAENFPFCTIDPNENKYAYANSYYPHTEDVDPVERVNHLLAAPPSFSSLSSLDSQSLIQEKTYSTRSAQIRYLESNPVSFIILGKPGIGEQELGKCLADYWKCVYIEPQLLIEQEIQSGSRAGQCIEFNLRCGRAVGIDVILRLVEKRVNSESARHRGFVICGLPLIPNDLYSEDPVSSESAVFNVREIFEEVLEATVELGVPPPSKPHVSIASKYDSIEGEGAEGKEADVEGEEAGEGAIRGEGSQTFPDVLPMLKQEPSIPIDIGADYDVCQPPEIGTNYEDQLAFLFNLMRDPFLIIYITCSTTDVLEKRDHYRFDIYTQENVSLFREKYDSLIYKYFSKEKGLSADEIPEELFEIPFPDDHNLHKHLVKMPRNFKANVSTQLDSFHYTGLRFIEQKVLMHDPQYYVKVDGRTSVQRMFNIVRTKMKTLPLQSVALPGKLAVAESQVDVGEGGPPPPPQNMTLEDAYREFCRRLTPSSIFKWTWSDWGTKCPVSMRDGIYRDGTQEYAVHFMNNIFFLADEDAYIRFFRNPRPYLLPPFPKTTCKFFIFGPKCAGKTAVANCLAFNFSGTVLSTNAMIRDLVSEKLKEIKEKIRQAAIAEAMILLDEMRVAEAEEKERQRVEDIKEWVNMITDSLEKLADHIEERDKEVTTKQFEISSFPMAMQKKATAEMETEITIAIRQLTNMFEEYSIPVPNTPAQLRKMAQDKKKLLLHIPDDLKHKVKPKPASVYDDFVVEYAENAVANANFDVGMANENVLDMFIEGIKKVEENYIEMGNSRGGWILDGMMCEIDLIDALYPDYIGDEIIVLLDEEGDEFLINRYQQRGLNQFSNYRQFFMEMGRVDAAWRAPTEVLPKPFPEAMVRDVLSEIFDDNTKFRGMADKDVSYRRELEIFREKWEDVKAYFIGKGREPIEIKVTNKSIPDLMTETLRLVEDRYRVKAMLYTEEDRAEEVRNFGVQAVQEEGMAEGPLPPVTDGEDPIEKNRRYGDTYNFCPVTFAESWVLWKGKEDHAVKFEDKVYLFANQENRDKFLMEPRKYLTGNPPESIPPPRICIIGMPGSKKTDLGVAVAHNYGMMFFSYEELIKNAFHISSPEHFDDLRSNERINPVLRDYLNTGSALPEEIYSEVLYKLWFVDPTKKLGFILDDFPKRPVDIQFMIKYRLIPDVIICLASEEMALKASLLGDLTESWQAEAEIRRATIEAGNNQAIEEWEAKRQQRFTELLNERREKRYMEKRQELHGEGDESSPGDTSDATELKAASQVSFDSVADQRDMDEINRILDVELPELVLEKLPEVNEEIILQFETEITTMIALENEAVKNVTEICKPEMIEVVQVRMDFEYFFRNYRNVLFVVDKVKYRSPALFERCYEVSMEVAERLLSCGYYFLSKFGKTCPVQYAEDKIPFQMFLPMEQRYNVFPVIHRNYIYFIIGREAVEKFRTNPLKYMMVDRIRFPLIPFNVAVSGPPKSGKTILADRIRNTYGMKLVSRGQAIRYVMSYMPFCQLAVNMEEVLRKGWEVTDEMVARCVEATSMDPRAVTQASRVPVPDERFDYLCEYFKPLSKVPAFLNVVDIAGLVKGASEGQGLGNAFLSHISACDAIFHLCRAFEDDDVTHVEGEVNPVRDLDIISEELRLKDEETLTKNSEKLEKTVGRGGDKKLKPEYDTLAKIKSVLVDEKKHIRFGDWDAKDIEVLNKYLFLTTKPALYLVNLSEKDYIKKKNKWLIKIKEWVDKNDPGAHIIPFSGAFEQKLVEEYSDPALRKKFLEEHNTTSALDKIIVQGYKALQLEYFFTAGPDEVKAWTIQKGTKAPQAAGKIHTDFEKGFIMAEVMKFNDFKEEGSEAAAKAAGKYRQQGRNYVVEDGDIIFFKFNAGAGLQQAKKK